MAVLGGPVRRTGRIGSHEDRDHLDLLVGDLRERPVDHGDVISGGVRAGVPRAQQHRERLAGFVRVGVERVEPIPVLVVPGCLLLLGVRGDQRRVDIDRQGFRCPVQIPEPRPCAGVRRAHRVQRARRRRDPVDHPERGRVRRDLTEQGVLIADRAQVRDTLTTVGEHHREIAEHPARIMATTPLLARCQPRRQRTCQPDLVRDLPEQRSPRVRHQTCSVRRHFYGYWASVTHHLQGETSKARDRGLQQPKNPCCAGRSRALGHPGGAGLTARSGLATRACRFLVCAAAAAVGCGEHAAGPDHHQDDHSVGSDSGAPVKAALWRDDAHNRGGGVDRTVAVAGADIPAKHGDRERAGRDVQGAVAGGGERRRARPWVMRQAGARVLVCPRRLAPRPARA
jgi:hypothetical protein